MAYGLMYEFPAGVTPAQYDAVNEKLGIDGSDPKSNWPKGLITHAAGTITGGGFSVYEVWAAKADQEAFMSGRLGPALATIGVLPPSRLTEVELHNHQEL